jgi:NAD(P)-dependent dehydrogenase (short-subunit alcohol dehydrogenase family)
MKLRGKVALITGAASGIGKSIAELFAREGASLALADRNVQGAEAIAARMSEGGTPALAMSLDVAEASQVRDCVTSTTRQLGPIDILVNSAGIAHLQPFLETSIQDFDRVYAINVRGTFLMGQEVARSMLARGGSIINIASASGRRGNHGRSAYGCGKAAVIHLTQTMAVELAEHRIRVNVLAPGPIVTPLVPDAWRQSWTSAVPMSRFGEPEEIATVALFLASEDSSYVTGHCLDVDGGFYAAGILRH